MFRDALLGLLVVESTQCTIMKQTRASIFTQNFIPLKGLVHVLPVKSVFHTTSRKDNGTKDKAIEL